VVALAALGPTAPPLAAGVEGTDLAQVYPATLDYVPRSEAKGLTTELSDEDVWTLSSFEIDCGDDLDLRFGLCDLVVGHHEGDALWAVVFPRRKSKISSRLAGDDEEIRHVWLRFHPQRIADLFPERTVRGPGEAVMYMWATRVYDTKAGDSWAVAGLPIVPPRETVIVDIDTEDGTRRHFTVDLDEGRARYSSNYVAHAVPLPEPMERRDAAAVVEAAWQTIEDRYPCFVDLPDLDWQDVHKDFPRRGSRCESRFEAAVLVREMLGELDDDWVWVRDGKKGLPGFEKAPPKANASWTGIRYILKLKHEEYSTWWGEMPTHVGYLRLWGEDKEERVAELDEVLEKLQATWSLIIDLRQGWPLDDAYARKVAGRFLAEPRTFGAMRVRDGSPDHGLGDLTDQVCEPRGPWRYEAPVYVLVGPRTAGAGERLARMLAGRDEVTVVGAPTRGRGLTAEWLELPHGFAIHLPTALDFDSSGARFRNLPLEPDHAIPVEQDELDDEHDPVLYQTLELILDTPQGDRGPGRPGAVSEVVEHAAGSDSGGK